MKVKIFPHPVYSGPTLWIQDDQKRLLFSAYVIPDDGQVFAFSYLPVSDKTTLATSNEGYSAAAAICRVMNWPEPDFDAFHEQVRTISAIKIREL